MKKTVFMLLVALLGLTVQGFSQEDKSKRASPSAQTKAVLEGKTITIDYSRPAIKGRKVWGGLVPYGEVWRTGANETTTLEVSEDVMVEGQKLPKGKYALFTIPGEKEWIIIFNKGISWGAYSYKESEDVLRVKVTPKALKETHELFTIEVFDKGIVSLMWDNKTVDFQVE